jgi:hypothetical protein
LREKERRQLLAIVMHHGLAVDAGDVHLVVDKIARRWRIELKEIFARSKIEESNRGPFNISIHMMTDLRFALRQLRKSPDSLCSR